MKKQLSGLRLILLIIVTIEISSHINEDKKYINKEIGGSLLDLISSPFDEIKTSQKNYNNLFISKSMKEADPNQQIYHTPFPNKETTKMRKWGIVTIAIFGTVFLFIRSGYNHIKNINKFFAKGVYSLANQSILLFICYTILIACYTFGAFDSIVLNWEYLIGAIGIVFLGWALYNFILTLLALSVNTKWAILESQAVSYEDLKRKIRDLEAQNKSITQLKEAFEFYILKRFFFVPLFPVLKSVSLRDEMSFSFYLSQCLLRKLRLFFKISWTTWLSLIFALMFWYVLIVPSSALTQTLCVMLIPLVGIGITLGIYIYCNIIYRKVVEPITGENINDYQDYKSNTNDVYQSMNYPKYLSKLIREDQELNEARKDKFTFHE